MVFVSFSLAIAVPFLASSWATFIEPNRLTTTSITWKLPKKHAHLHDLRIAQISDLHFQQKTPKKFLKRISESLKHCAPDIIVFSGDFLCRARIEDRSRLEAFLNTLSAPLGIFAILGNHDYVTYVSRNNKGIIDRISSQHSQPIKRAMVSVMQGLFSKCPYRYADDLTPQEPHPDLVDLLKNTPVTLLHNTTHVLSEKLNIVGCGDLFARQFLPEVAFANYNPTLPGILLSHNPDTSQILNEYPGDFIFSGHSHGPQIALPWPKFGKKFFERLSGLENPHLARGLFTLEGGKYLYVNRGLGGLKRTRFCSCPEICYVRCSHE
ncbi:UDP-2,3-diacylglucosamine diphosphatase LpxG [Candidatus Chlamydia sanziniae]|uniref:Phosphohydrolase n=1 Tax=Candidatus Chlamydia sanziniae TaxID=1806891 RepID=A0A1A9HTQ6_9CHLA|nr:UDP-2,3-diacylglucosamine diphosphatase LpxG [Candidatus Chlamydia sanziniae]ANH78378.1 phosphohydrolase [Candidatus Chlamydia sanziniae]